MLKLVIKAELWLTKFNNLRNSQYRKQLTLKNLISKTFNFKKWTNYDDGFKSR
jgi:hypothetical protein